MFDFESKPTFIAQLCLLWQHGLVYEGYQWMIVDFESKPTFTAQLCLLWHNGLVYEGYQWMIVENLGLEGVN